MRKWDRKVVKMFLTAYEVGTWAVSEAKWDWIEDRQPGSVEVIAERRGDGRTLAIEHTVIQPFANEKSDFHNGFKKLATHLRADESLRIPGVALRVEFPVDVLGVRAGVSLATQDAIVREIADWIRQHKNSFPTTQAKVVTCEVASHPNGALGLRVMRTDLHRTDKSFLLVSRYGPVRLDEVVDKAFQTKLPKLVATPADIRILLLERDQGSVIPEEVLVVVENLRPKFKQLADVHELWIVDAAGFDDEKGAYVAFHRAGHGFEFHYEELVHSW
jgi:hypothetical protein